MHERTAATFDSVCLPTPDGLVLGIRDSRTLSHFTLPVTASAGEIGCIYATVVMLEQQRVKNVRLAPMLLRHIYRDKICKKACFHGPGLFRKA